MERGNDSCLFQLVIANVIASDDMVGLSAFDWCCQDSIAVISIQDKDVVVALAGDEGEASW